MSRGKKASQKEERQTTTAEKITLGLSVLILLALAGLVIYQALRSGSQEASVVVTPRYQELRQEGDLYYLPVEVFNVGNQTAESLTVFFTLETPGDGSETGSFTISFLAGGARARGVVVFSNAPDAENLSHTMSYLLP